MAGVRKIHKMCRNYSWMQNGHISTSVETHFQLPDTLGLCPMRLITSRLRWAKWLAIGLAVGEEIRFVFLSFFPDGKLCSTAALSKLFLAARLLRHSDGSLGNIKCGINKSLQPCGQSLTCIQREFWLGEAFEKDTRIHFSLDAFQH